MTIVSAVEIALIAKFENSCVCEYAGVFALYFLRKQFALKARLVEAVRLLLLFISIFIDFYTNLWYD